MMMLQDMLFSSDEEEEGEGGNAKDHPVATQLNDSLLECVDQYG